MGFVVELDCCPSSKQLTNFYPRREPNPVDWIFRVKNNLTILKNTFCQLWTGYLTIYIHHNNQKSRKLRIAENRSRSGGGAYKREEGSTWQGKYMYTEYLRVNEMGEDRTPKILSHHPYHLFIHVIKGDTRTQGDIMNN